MRVKCCLCGADVDHLNAFTLDDEIDDAGYTCTDEDLLGGFICLGCADEIGAYGSLLHYYGPEGEFNARFLDMKRHDTGKKTIVYHYWTDMDTELEDEDRLMDIVNLIEAIMRTYIWEPSGPYTGVYQPKKDAIKGWERAIKAWLDPMAMDTVIGKIIKLINDAKSGKLGFPIVVVYPRSSNVAVFYMDIWAPSQHKTTVQKAILGEKEEAFSLEKGFSVQKV